MLSFDVQTITRSLFCFRYSVWLWAAASLLLPPPDWYLRNGTFRIQFQQLSAFIFPRQNEFNFFLNLFDSAAAVSLHRSFNGVNPFRGVMKVRNGFMQTAFQIHQMLLKFAKTLSYPERLFRVLWS